MNLVSTRTQEGVTSFKEALLRGLAPDGGLYIPVEIPKLQTSDLKKENGLIDLATLVLEAWLNDEVSTGALHTICEEALSFEIPLQDLEGTADLTILELFHGPTLSFKDVAARIMARFMAHFNEGESREITILVATSGDTGSAVADAFSGLDGIRVVILYPSGKVSRTQELQLTLARPGLKTLAVEGNFDHCQAMVKEAFRDPRLKKLRLSSANSINIGRLLPQSVFYHWAFKELNYEPSNFIVPSGNLGNLCAGMLAAEMLDYSPQFTSALNQNNSLERFLLGEELSTTTIASLSNAMDVSIPSNLERITHLFSTEQLKKKLRAYSFSDDETLAEIKRSYDQWTYLADPHTAVGLCAYRQLFSQGDATKKVCLSTAHPAKFAQVIDKAIGMKVDHEGLSVLENAAHQKVEIAAIMDDLVMNLLE